jgi:hypothetical protein
MTAIETANKQYQYDDIMRGKSLHYWASEVNIRFSALNNWKVSVLKKGSFGYDNLIMSIGKALQETESMEILRKSDLADKIHQGWAINYVYWRDNCPYEYENTLYIKPYTPLGDVRRDLCALQTYDELPTVEKEKDDSIADILLNLLATELLAK